MRADEGHKVKNPQTQFSRFIHGLQFPIIDILTATPFMNKVIDGLGYLTLFWRDQMDLDENEALDGTVQDWFGNDGFVPEHTAAYLPGGVYHFAVHQQRFWRLKPITFKAITQHHILTILPLRSLSSFLPE